MLSPHNIDTCSGCAPTPIREDLAPSPNTLETGYSVFGQLTKFSRSCQRCSIILQGVLHFARMFRAQVEPADIHIECVSRYKGESSFGAALMGRQNKLPTDISFRFNNMPEMSPIAIQIATSDQTMRRSPLNIQTEKSLATIDGWVCECDTTHQEMCAPSTQLSLPSRLLDVGNDTIRLIQSGEAQRLSRDFAFPRYVALSHCWSKETILTTTLSNLQEMMEGFSAGHLSKTFQDAIVITRHLGVRFLWIDSLCIIQNDQQDWEKESARMASVYKNAFLTIAATRSVDGRGGCFSAVSETPYIWQKQGVPTGKNSIQSTSSTLVWHEKFWEPVQVGDTRHFTCWMSLRPSYDVRYLSLKDTSKGIVDRGFPLFTRAWFLQERLLSRRVLHFGHMELFWECRCAFWTELFGPEPEDRLESNSGSRKDHISLFGPPGSEDPVEFDSSSQTTAKKGVQYSSRR